MINLCLVVIATQFSETKEREERLMAEQRHKLHKSQSMKSFNDGFDSFYETVFIYIQKAYAKMKFKIYLCLLNAAKRRRMPKDLTYNCGSIVSDEGMDGGDGFGGGFGDNVDKHGENDEDGGEAGGQETNSFNVHYHNHYYQQHLHFHINQEAKQGADNENSQKNEISAIMSPNSEHSVANGETSTANKVSNSLLSSQKSSNTTPNSVSTINSINSIKSINQLVQNLPPNLPPSIISVISKSTETTPESIRRLSSSNTSSTTNMINHANCNLDPNNNDLVALLYRAPSNLTEASAVSYILKLPQTDSRCAIRSDTRSELSAPTPHTEQLTNQALAPTVLFSSSPKLNRPALKTPISSQSFHKNGNIAANVMTAYPQNFQNHHHFRNQTSFQNSNFQNSNSQNSTPLNLNFPNSDLQNSNHPNSNLHNSNVQCASFQNSKSQVSSHYQISNPQTRFHSNFANKDNITQFSNPFTLPPTTSTGYLSYVNSLTATVQPLPFSRSSSSSTSASGGSGNIRFLDAALQAAAVAQQNACGSPIPTITENNENNENCELDAGNAEIESQGSPISSNSLTQSPNPQSPITQSSIPHDTISSNSISSSSTISPVPAIPQNTPIHRNMNPDPSNSNQNSNNNKPLRIQLTPNLNLKQIHHDYQHLSQQNITLVNLSNNTLLSPISTTQSDLITTNLITTDFSDQVIENITSTPEDFYNHPLLGPTRIHKNLKNSTSSSNNKNNNSNILMNHPFYESCEYQHQPEFQNTRQNTNFTKTTSKQSRHRKLFKNFSNNNNLTASSSRASFKNNHAGNVQTDRIADFLDCIIKVINLFDKSVNYVQSHLESVVDSKYFGRCIMGAIVVNTVSMGIEHHRQPQYLTELLEIANIVFTTVFFLEMVAKVGAKGLFHYLQAVYNLFDAAIVIISVFEIVEGIKDPVGHGEGGSLSVLRTFRLTRVLKLIRFMPALRRQLSVLVKTIDNVATFMLLLFLFIFIFAILGMHLFGCKFCFAAGEEEMALFHQLSKDEQHQIELKNTCGDASKRPARANFNSLLWAFVTVFQILTQEDWNLVMYNGMQTTTPLAALYFIVLMTIGNYVLFNLLVAILVEGFQSAEEPDDSEVDEKEKRDCSYIRIPDDIANLISCMRDASIEGHHPYDKRSAELARALSSGICSKSGSNNGSRVGSRIGTRQCSPDNVNFGFGGVEKDKLETGPMNSVKTYRKNSASSTKIHSEKQQYSVRNSARNSETKVIYSDISVFENENGKNKYTCKEAAKIKHKKKPMLSIEPPPPSAITSQNKPDHKKLEINSLNIPFLNVVAATPSQSRAETPCLDAKSLLDRVGEERVNTCVNSKTDPASIPAIELPETKIVQNSDEKRRHSDNQSCKNMSVPGTNLQAISFPTIQASISSLSVASTQLPNQNLIASTVHSKIWVRNLLTVQNNLRPINRF